MPEISLFCGIRVMMFYSDHNPPHFHAEYGGCKALIEIQNACVIRGALPSRQLKLILAWCELHKDELMQNWELARDAKPLNCLLYTSIFWASPIYGFAEGVTFLLDVMSSKGVKSAAKQQIGGEQKCG